MEVANEQLNNKLVKLMQDHSSTKLALEDDLRTMRVEREEAITAAQAQSFQASHKQELVSSRDSTSHDDYNAILLWKYIFYTPLIFLFQYLCLSVFYCQL